MSDQSSRSEAPTTFRGTIRTARKALGMSQETEAEALKVTQPTVSAWESGAGYPTPGNLVSLADLLSLDEGELLRLMVAETGAVPA